MAQRTCVDCGTDIPGSNPAVKRCPECCADIMRAAGLRPLEPYPGGHARWKCLCLCCGSEVSPMFANVQERGRGCNPCGRRAQAEARRLSHDEAKTTMLAAGVAPLVPYPGDSSQPWECRCMRCGNVVFPRYNDIQQGQGGCRRCAAETTADLWRTPQNEAVALALMSGLKPLEPYRNNHTRWRCLCLICQQETYPRLTSLQRGSAGCAWCSRHLVHPDEAGAAMRAAGFEPLEPFSRSNERWRCQCVTCGNIVEPTYCSVQAGHGCRWCSPGGFKAAKEAFAYLITNAAYGAVKVGVSDTSGGRLLKHRKQGWETVVTVTVPGHVALAVEGSILSWWRCDLGLPIYLGHEEMPHGGWTETASLLEVNVTETVRRMRIMAVG